VKTLAIDIGGTKFSVAVFDGDKIIRRETRSTDRQGGREALLAGLAPMITGERVDRCGIGFGGPVDWVRQRVILSTHVPGWDDFDLPACVGRLLGGVPVVMDRDTQAGVLGEYRFGAGKGCSPLFYMTLSTGIGGGFLVDGRVLRGVDSWASEIGHLNVRPDGPPCLCGSNGCLERMCAGLWLERDGRSIADEEYAADLARGLKACIMLLNPARIVIGGGIAKAGEALFGPLREELARQMPPWSCARVDLQPAALGDDSVLYGAKALADLSTSA